MAIFEYGEYQNTYEAPGNLVEIFENSAAFVPMYETVESSASAPSA